LIPFTTALKFPDSETGIRFFKLAKNQQAESKAYLSLEPTRSAGKCPVKKFTVKRLRKILILIRFSSGLAEWMPAKRERPE